MKIEITTREYRDLLDILHTADVVMSGHRKEQNSRTAPHRALIQKLYSLAKGEALDQLIRHDANSGNYVPTESFEHDTVAHGVIDEFADHLFWDGLINRLAARDAATMAGGIERLNAMSDHDRQQVEGPIRQRYIAEFTASGVANLQVIEHFSATPGAHVQTSD